MSRGPGTDAQLVERARSGEVAAFDRLVMRHRGRLYDIARQTTGQAEAAQDVVQEALLRAFRSLDSLRDGARFGQWLNTIVRRQSIQWLRDGRRTPQPTESAALYSLVGAGWVSPEPPAEVVALVREALGALSQRERHVMILHYLEGFTCQEIAGKLGVSAGRVKRILYDSRRKARTECRAMTDAERRRGPRALKHWLSGGVPRGEWNVLARLGWALAQSVCLSVNKRPKSLKEIAAEVEAHERYVEDMVADLSQFEVLVSPRKGTYLLNFIAFDAEHWRKLAARMGQPAGELAHRLAQSQRTLRKAYDQTPLAAEWSWEDVVWVVNCFLVAQRGIARFLGGGVLGAALAPPARPGGVSYWLAGHEATPDVPDRSVAPGWYGNERPGWGWGLGQYGPCRPDEVDWILTSAPLGERPLPPAEEVLHGLVEGSRSEGQLLAEFKEEAREEYRATLAKLVSQGLVARADGDAYRLTFPVWREGDSEALTPVIDDVTRPLVEDVLTPTWSDLDHLLDEMGYEHRRDQYPLWQSWLCWEVLGAALEFMVKQGTLPHLGDPPPAKWSFTAWKGDLPLMRLTRAEGD